MLNISQSGIIKKMLTRGKSEENIAVKAKSKIKSKKLQGDFVSIIFLLSLYMIQGIPLGISSVVPLLIQDKVSYSRLSIFSLVSLPFSLKLLWAPIVDAKYFKAFGRRKSWIIPLQAACGFLMIYFSNNVGIWLDEGGNDKNFYLLTFFFLLLFFLMATQDIAVDGWAITMLSKKNRHHASTCNILGQNVGNSLSQLTFLTLHSKQICFYLFKKYIYIMHTIFYNSTYYKNVHQNIEFAYPAFQPFLDMNYYLKLWGSFILLLTVLTFFKKENNEFQTYIQTQIVPKREKKKGIYIPLKEDINENKFIKKQVQLKNINDLKDDITGPEEHTTTTTTTIYGQVIENNFENAQIECDHIIGNSNRCYNIESIEAVEKGRRKNGKEEDKQKVKKDIEHSENETEDDTESKGDLEVEEESNPEAVINAYKNLHKLIHLPPVKLFVLLSIMSRIPFASVEVGTNFKILKRGITKEEFSLFSPFYIPVSIISPALIGSLMKNLKPLDVYYFGYKIRFVSNLFLATLLPLTHYMYLNKTTIHNSYFFFYYVYIFIIQAFNLICVDLMTVSSMGFQNIISDPRIGGTYMTFLNTVNNLSSSAAKVMFLWLFDYTDNKICYKGKCLLIDGYYTQMLFSIVIGFFFCHLIFKYIKQIQDLPIESWRLNCEGETDTGRDHP